MLTMYSPGLGMCRDPLRLLVTRIVPWFLIVVFGFLLALHAVEETLAV